MNRRTQFFCSISASDLAQALRLAAKKSTLSAAGGAVVFSLDSAQCNTGLASDAINSLTRISPLEESRVLVASHTAAPLAFYLSPSACDFVRSPASIAEMAAAFNGTADPLTGESPVAPIAFLLAHMRRAGQTFSDIPCGDSFSAPDAPSAPLAAAGTFHARSYARVGLLGNPTDGYGGKTTSVTISNFVAEAWVTPREDGVVELLPHTLYDPLRYSNVRQLSIIAQREGYSGGVRLMAATVNRLYQHFEFCAETLPPRGFTLRYHTTIPRQVGLAGSSALVTAMLRALLSFFGYGTEEAAASIGLSRDRFASFVLKIETEELGITAGLQDRVVQAYEGAVHMDFRLDTLKANDGMGIYIQLPVASLPPLFLAWAADPSDSGRIHAPVKQRWLAGDKEVVDGMNRIAALADEALELCMSE